MNWTKPFHGVTHCGNLTDHRRASIEDHGDFAILTKWWRGCGFSPENVTFDSLGEAKRAGEEWVARGGG